jgi:hypothetical protein
MFFARNIFPRLFWVLFKTGIKRTIMKGGDKIFDFPNY